MNLNSRQINVILCTVSIMLLEQTTVTVASDEESCSVCDCLVNAMDTLGILIDRKIEARLLSLVPDVDECDEGTHNCDENADCENTDGSFTCACKPGYQGDGTSCEDIDECDEGTHNCDENAECTNSEGSFSCVCNQGTVGDGTFCIMCGLTATVTDEEISQQFIFTGRTNCLVCQIDGTNRFDATWLVGVEDAAEATDPVDPSDGTVENGVLVFPDVRAISFLQFNLGAALARFPVSCTSGDSTVSAIIQTLETFER